MKIPVHTLIAYLRHQLLGGNAHGLHSPFVFDLYTKCISEKGVGAPSVIQEKIEHLRKAALRSTQLIDFQDFGATGKGRIRQITVGEIAHSAAKKPKVAQVLYRISEHLGARTIFDLGTSLGFTTAYLASSVGTEGKVTTFEGSLAVANLASQNFEQLGLNNIHQVIGDLDLTLPEVLEQQVDLIDFAFLDANHTYEATLNYYQQIQRKTHANSCIVLDDIYWSKGMTQAWEEIKQRPEVTASVDLFYVGLLFFRPGQVKQHFRLKI